jgi:hypothetical protein
VDAFGCVLALVQGSGQAGGSLRSWLAADVRAWLASPAQGLTAEIDSTLGPQAGADALARLAPSRLAVVATVSSERRSWAEVTRQCDADPGPETCLAGLTHDLDGRVSRLVWLRAALVPPGGGDVDDGVPDGRPVLEDYFAALMASRFREAAAHFTADTLYSHPPYAAGEGRVLFQGRDALLRGFETERGPSPTRQIITDFWQHGGRVFLEGVIEGIPNGGTFFSTASITRAGEIGRYVAFYSSTRIAQ